MLYSQMVSALRGAVKSWRQHGDDVRWSYDEKLPGKPGEILLECIQDYFMSFYKENRNEANSVLSDIAQLMVETKPDSAVTWNDLSLACARVGNWQGQHKALLKAVEIDPNDPVVLWNLAFSYARLDLPERAIPLLEHLIQVGGDDERAKAI